jgi:hypothetical protein
MPRVVKDFMMEIDNLQITIAMEGYYELGKYDGCPESCYPPEGEVQSWEMTQVEMLHEGELYDITDDKLIDLLCKRHHDLIVEECWTELEID